MIQIETVEAVGFDALLTSGRTSPPLLACERLNGSTVQAVVKFGGTHHCTSSSLCAKMISAQLAADLGSPVPVPVFVNWELEFCDAIADVRTIRVMVKRRCHQGLCLDEAANLGSPERRLCSQMLSINPREMHSKQKRNGGELVGAAI